MIQNQPRIQLFYNHLVNYAVLIKYGPLTIYIYALYICYNYYISHCRIYKNVSKHTLDFCKKYYYI